MSNVTRYRLAGMEESAIGNWVSVKDHMKVVQRLELALQNIRIVADSDALTLVDRVGQMRAHASIALDGYPASSITGG